MGRIVINVDDAQEIKAEKIVYWYDRHTRLWVVQVTNDDGLEITDWEYAEMAHNCHGSALKYTIKMFQEKFNVTTVEKL